VRCLATLALLLAVGCGDSGAQARDAAIDGPSPDAPPAPCGIEEPGSKCASPTLLLRCAGTDVESVDCAAMHQLCASDPADPSGAACVAPGDPCGNISVVGACEGNILSRCVIGHLQILDCTTVYGQCTYSPLPRRFECTTPCSLAGVSAEGACAGNAIRRCDYVNGNFAVVTDPCPDGTMCVAMNPDTGLPACLRPECSTMGAVQGVCLGDTLIRCVSGVVRDIDCPATGQTCAWTGPGGGNQCVAVADAGAFRISGVVSYEDRPQGRGFLLPRRPVPARGAQIMVVEDVSGRVLASSPVGDDGAYQMRFDPALASYVHLLVAAASTSPQRPTRVLRPDGLLHGYPGPSFVPGYITIYDLTIPDDSGEAEAFNILDQAVATLDAVRALVGTTAPVPLLQVWVRGGTVGTFTQGATSFFLGGVSDDDGYDDAVISHELGHTVQNLYGRPTEVPAAIHFIGVPEDPRIAWNEGFATYWSSLVRGDPVYVDTKAEGGFFVDIDTDLTRARLSAPMTQNISESTVSEILWDVGDAPVPDDDPLAGSHAAVVAVEHGYLGANPPNRGFTGADLVDFLDGWLVQQGTATCPALGTIVVDQHQFPYDFQGPVPCP
jgi:hypothetical protein